MNDNRGGKREGAGRPKGSQNKSTKEVRDVLNKIISNELENLPMLLNEMSSKVRAEILCKMLPFVVPKLRNTGIESNWFDIAPPIQGLPLIERDYPDDYYNPK